MRLVRPADIAAAGPPRNARPGRRRTLRRATATAGFHPLWPRDTRNLPLIWTQRASGIMGRQITAVNRRFDFRAGRPYPRRSIAAVPFLRRLPMRLTFFCGCLFLVASCALNAAELSTYFPPSEDQGGWRTLLPETGEPDAAAKARIKETTGVDWDKLAEAWKHNEAAPGATGLIVIRKGHVVGEWYRGGDRTKAFNIYSSSKSYTSTAFGLILDDFGGKPPSGKKLTLDTKVCNAEWLPESLPLSDPRKSEITVRQ